VVRTFPTSTTSVSVLDLIDLYAILRCPLLVILNYFAGSKPRTMNKEWVAANQEYMKFQKMNPIFGA
jgi:hypothetical protein